MRSTWRGGAGSRCGASALSFEWEGVRINLIDTPGHIDFSAEVERSLRVLDCAVLVLSAVEGIQAQTESIWAALEALSIPVILFVNKLDRIGADTARVVDDLKRRFFTRRGFWSISRRRKANRTRVSPILTRTV